MNIKNNIIKKNKVFNSLFNELLIKHGIGFYDVYKKPDGLYDIHKNVDKA